MAKIMLATRDDITKYIPQRHPIVMVHALVEADDNHAVTELEIESDNVFLSEGFFAEPGLVENIAQTAAMHVGYQCSLKNIPIPIGYIAAVKDLKIQALPRQNSRISTTVTITNKVLDVTVVEGRVEQEGNLLCSCEMRIFAKINAKK
ncbi:MAG TPA: 3-hydroxyacyl-ACP dehydratase [Chryseolinea sp.]|nr:3-hydroxyacyl-ACP dehydratase [Chryseolinea sp.]